MRLTGRINPRANAYVRGPKIGPIRTRVHLASVGVSRNNAGGRPQTAPSAVNLAELADIIADFLTGETAADGTTVVSVQVLGTPTYIADPAGRPVSVTAVVRNTYSDETTVDQVFTWTESDDTWTTTTP